MDDVILFSTSIAEHLSPHSSFPNSCKYELDDVTRICWDSVLALEVCMLCVHTHLLLCVEKSNKEIQKYSNILNKSTSNASR